MPNRIYQLFLYCTWAAVTIVSSQALSAEEWEASWVDTENGQALTPTSALRLKIPPNLSQQTTQNLGAEIDGFDVSSFAIIDKDLITINPAEPYKSGRHELRLVEYSESQIIDRGSWAFEIAKAKVAINIEGNLSGTLAHRLGSDGLDKPKPPQTTSNGSLSGTATLAKDNWQIKSDLTSLFNSQKLQTTSGDRVEGNIRLSGLFQGDHLDTEAHLGRHTIGVENTLMNNFERRGASLTLKTKKDRLSFSVFAQKPEDVVSVDNVVGLNNQNHRIAGAHIILRPIKRFKDTLLFTGTYYGGDGQDFGTGGFGSETVEANGYSIAAQSHWFNNRLYIAAEAANNTTDYGLGASDSEAYSGQIRYEAVRNHMVSDSPLSLVLGVNYNHIGTFFKSLANQGLSSDQESTLLYSELYWGGFSGQFQANRINNNVDDITVISEDRVMDYRVTSNYVPSWTDIPAWLGSPSFYLNGNHTIGERRRTPNGYLGVDYDQVQQGVATGMTASYSKWSWNLGYGYSSYDDKTNNVSDRNENSIDLGLSYYPSGKLSLSPYVRRVIVKDEDLNFEDEFWDVGLSGQVSWIPETLDTSFNTSVSLQSGDTAMTDTYVANMETNWVFKKSDNNKPGFALGISTSYIETQNVFFEDTEQFQVFARLKLIMPIRYAR